MFKLTEKAKAFNKFIIQHTVCGDYDLTSDYSSIEEAIAYEAKDAACSKEEIALTIREYYTQEEVIEAAKSGYGWPVRLGLVEEVDEDEEESKKMGINTTAPAKFLNFDKNKLQFFFSDEAEFTLISEDTFVNVFTGSLNQLSSSWSVEDNAIFALPGDLDEFRNRKNLEILGKLASEVGSKFVFDVKDADAYVFVHEVLGNSLEVVAKAVVGKEVILPVFVRVEWGRSTLMFEYNLHEVLAGGDYHPEIFKAVDKFIDKKYYLHEVDVSLDQAKDMATYILSKGGAEFGMGVGWMLGDVKNKAAQSVVDKWSGLSSDPMTEFEEEVVGHLKDYLLS